MALLLLFITILTPPFTTQTNPHVQTSQGHYQGSTLYSSKGKPHFAFRGISYALPPDGEFRFKPPRPVPPHKGIYPATKDGSPCPQMDFEQGGIFAGEENCLFLNIYTPEIDTNNLKPVMVFIHGGAFNYGSAKSEAYGAGRFMEYDVILVTINYRLGVLGFLNVNEDFAPGNVGLLDQVEALKWIKANIRGFGGDPDRVTLFGQSAGGAAVIYHLISPLSKGLFHRGIAQSGSAFCKWAHVDNPLYWATRFAADLKCPVKPLESMVECLRMIPVKKLVQNTVKYYEFLVWPMPFVPSVQHVKPEINFLMHTPSYLLRNGPINNVPILSGGTRDEGVTMYLPLLHLGALQSEFFEKSLTKFINSIFDLKGQTQTVVDAVKKLYFEGVSLEDESKSHETIIEVISDAMNKACGLKTVEFLVSRSIPTFMYTLEHKLNQSITQRLFKFKENLGVAHGDDLVLQFDGPNFIDNPLSPDDEIVSHQLMSLWTYFAHNGVPTEKSNRWSAVTNLDEISCLNITNTLSEVKISNTDKIRLWNDLVDQLRHHSIPSRTEL